MPNYEHIFMVRQDASNSQVETLTEQFKTVLGENGGTVTKTEYWGIKPLAYKIRKNRKAHYTLLNLDAPPAAIAEMERQMKINEDIIRFLTLRVDEPEEGPSAMMRARPGRDRDERPRGGQRGDRFGDRDRGDRGDRGGERRGPRDGDAQRERPRSQESA